MKRAMVLAALAALSGAVSANNIIQQQQTKQATKSVSKPANSEQAKSVKTTDGKQNKPVIQKSKSNSSPKSIQSPKRSK